MGSHGNWIAVNDILDRTRFKAFLTYFNDRCVTSVRCALRAGSGSQARGGRRLSTSMPRSALCSLRGKKRELERSRQCESRQAPAASLISLSASVNLSVKKQLGPPWHSKVFLSCLGPRTVPNAERSTRCPGANLEADRSTWVQFKVSRAEPRCVGIFNCRGRRVIVKLTV